MTQLLGGYTGRMLWVDLTNRSTHIDEIGEAYVKKWLGGSGFAVDIVSKMVPTHADPLGPDNILGFFTGPLTGTVVPSSGRHCVAGKSPLTNIWGEASIGGSWGRALKYAGYDSVIVTGQASEPVYIWINDDEIEIRPAGKLWGMDTYEIEGAIRSLTHPKAQVLSIGPAGERLSRIAGIFSDGSEGRTAARCGLGAIAGAKKLKAIAVYGAKTLNYVEKDKLLKSIREVIPNILANSKGLADLGTAGLVIPCEKIGDFPVKNWKEGSWEEGAMKINGVVLKDKYLIKQFHCSGCPIGCGRTISIKNGKYPDVYGGGPEYETLGLFGGSCMIDDLETICYANELCNRYGIDTIEVGNLIAFCMEAYEKGIITKDDTEGREIRWGDSEIFLNLVKEIGEGSGLGLILNQGFPGVIRRFGNRAKEIGIFTKGLSFPAHDPRASNSLAVGYATSNRGACHCDSFSYKFAGNKVMSQLLGIDRPIDRFEKKGQGILAAKAQNLMAIFDSVAMCKFTIFGGSVTPKLIAEWLTYTTGLEWSVEELLQCGERIFNMKRLYNIKCGIDRNDDSLPQRIIKEPRDRGGAAENLPPLELMLDEYYEYRGWDQQGVPRKDKLASLGIYSNDN